LHEGRAQPRPRYGRAALASWVSRIEQHFAASPAYVYCNNDSGGAAVVDAVAFAAIARRRGREVTRTPS
jgi:uncharacterized protein YecE (DUF72 family)